MTDYSKLSDAEIAERVCVKLGAPGYKHGMYSPQKLVEWLSGLLGRGLAKFVPHNTTRTAVESYFKYLCFDWPAPIMMQKVKEWLVEDEINPCIEYVGKHWWVRLVPDEDRPDCWYGPTRNEIEARALYEAFLQVGE